MSCKIIKMHHKLCDYTCMWNGIEDLYERKMGEEVPDYFFFCLSGIGNFVYLKFDKGRLRRMAGWGDGRTKKMYQAISDTAGFTYKHIEGRSFEYAMKKAKEQIDMDSPVVLGALDMYYLNYYPKFYHMAHIPIHYILMVGYDDEKQCAYFHDCGHQEIQKLSYADLEMALNIEKTELSDKNTVCCVDFSKDVKSIRRIAIEGFKAKAKAALNPPVSFVGIPGMRKLAKEILSWQNEMSEVEFRTSLENITIFTGTVPMLPDKLSGYRTAEDITHCAVRDRMGALFIELDEKYGIAGFKEAGKLFLQSGDILQNMTDLIVEYLIGNRSELNDLPGMISRIADIEEEAYMRIDEITSLLINKEHSKYA